MGDYTVKALDWGFRLQIVRIGYYHIEIQDYFVQDRMRHKLEDKAEIVTKVWYLFVAWYRALGFFMVYNLFTVQIGWFLR
jgi:hypothetical protein